MFQDDASVFTQSQVIRQQYNRLTFRWTSSAWLRLVFVTSYLRIRKAMGKF